MKATIHRLWRNLYAVETAGHPDVRQALRDWWDVHAVSQKREDAVALLAKLPSLQALDLSSAQILKSNFQ